MKMSTNYLILGFVRLSLTQIIHNDVLKLVCSTLIAKSGHCDLFNAIVPLSFIRRLPFYCV
jgi:hypothetical protein